MKLKFLLYRRQVLCQWNIYRCDIAHTTLTHDCTTTPNPPPPPSPLSFGPLGPPRSPPLREGFLLSPKMVKIMIVYLIKRPSRGKYNYKLYVQDSDLKNDKAYSEKHNVFTDTGFRKLKYNDMSRPHLVNFVNKFG
jgi:hypothetical protein